MAQAVEKPVGMWQSLLLVCGAAASFHVAYSTRFSFLIFGYVICLVQLARLPKMRFAFYAGFLAGFLCFAPQLVFFWRIFGLPAVALWAILAFWIALFTALAQGSLSRLGEGWTVLLAPLLWTGLEYFRSELYYLRFAWLNVGYALPGSHALGVYGVGFAAVFFASCMVTGRWKLLLLFVVIPSIALAFLLPGGSSLKSPPRRVQVAGVQMEFPSTDEVISNLDKVLAQHPDTQLLVLSEYTFESTIPDAVKAWCRDKQKYLVIGGIDPAHGGNYYDTAFVIGPDGREVFKQGKCVPIQFFSDGLPAPGQKVWDSPWGKIGICICYDLSYTRVTDELIRQGARAFIIPTMDVEGWGRHEHELHERVAVVRAAEYEVPIFRVASSGISQLVADSGEEKATAPFGEKGAIISGEMVIEAGVSHFQLSRLLLPVDRVLAPFSVAVTACFILWLVLFPPLRRLLRTSKSGQALEI